VARIHTYGQTIHSLVERKNYRGAFMPGFVPFAGRGDADGVGLLYIDHCVGNVELGAMNKWVKYYADVLGFSQLISFDDKTISTEYSALMSKVVANGNGRIKFPLNEPAKGKKKSQIGRRSSTRSSSARERRVSAPETSRHCSRRWSANRRCAGISRSCPSITPSVRFPVSATSRSENRTAASTRRSWSATKDLPGR